MMNFYLFSLPLTVACAEGLSVGSAEPEEVPLHLFHSLSRR